MRSVLNRDKELRRINRTTRLYKVFWLCRAFKSFYLMELTRTAIGQKKCYKEAENTATFINALFNKDMVKPAELLTPDDELTERSIEAYKDYNIWATTYASTYNTDIKEMEAFCRAAYYTHKCVLLQVDHLNIVHLLGAYVSYVSKRISKEELNEALFEVSIFEGKRKPNYRRLRRAIRDVEALADEIIKKRKQRKDKAGDAKLIVAK